MNHGRFFCGLLCTALLLPARAGDVIRIEPVEMPAESCQEIELPVPFGRVVRGDDLYGRLRPDLRGMARTADPMQTLVNAASYEYAQLATGFDNPRWGGEGRSTARAMADLAVTGRRSYAALEAMNLSRAQLTARIGAALPARMAEWGEDRIDPGIADQAASNIARRVHSVAWALRGPVDARETLRPGLGWIAVSGEDDRPHRPVNMESARFPQRNIAFSVAGQSLILRTVFMGEGLPDWPDAAPRSTSRLPTRQPIPTVSGDVLIFMHGHGSNAEEALALAPALFAEARQRGKELTILSLDLPGYAYSSTLDTTLFSTMPMDTFPNSFPGLAFLEAALDGLVSELDSRQPGFRERVVGVIGGSLGGNLGLRLASREVSSFSSPWLRNVVAWSPASVWPSFADDCGSRSGGVRRCADESDLAPSIAVIIGMFLSGDHGIAGAAGGAEALFLDLDAPTQRSLAVRGTHENAEDDFHDGKRGNFYSGSQLQSDSQFSIADKWYRDDWPCKENAIEAGKWSMGEYFSEAYSRWHWRIANEQLVFSHRDPPRPLFGAHRVYPKLLLIAGEADNHKPEYLYDSAIRLGAASESNYGRTIDLAATGHSVHAERPRLLARLIVDFVYETPPATIMAIAH